MKPLVSILLSYYRGEKYLISYLENVKSQTMVDKTQLIISACQLTEAEKSIIDAYRDKFNITLLEFSSRKPQSFCWNKAIKVAEADFCCIWNVDDVRLKTSLENQYKKLAANNNLVAAYGYFIISNEYGNRKGKLIDHSMYAKEEYTRSMLLGPFFMFRKSICEKCGYFDEQLLSGSDFDFAVRLAVHGDIEMGNFVDGYFLDEQKGLSTKGDGLQPTERTVVELRYGIIDKLEVRWINEARKYKTMEIKQGNIFYPIRNFVPNYDGFIKNNC